MSRKAFLITSLLVSFFFLLACNVFYADLSLAQEKVPKKSGKSGQVKSVPSKVKKSAGSDVGIPYATDSNAYGNIVISRNLPKSPMAAIFKPVVFPHWWHRTVFTCKVCHADIGFTMEAGADDIKMSDIQKGKWCGACHNGKIAFAPLLCPRCHSKDITVKENRSPQQHLSKLPINAYGNKVDWVKALDNGLVNPKADLDGKTKMMIFDRDIEFKIKYEGVPLPNVIFPHKQHTQWLFCGNCHTQIFQMKAGGNPVTMYDIFEGRSCGVCHGTVAFPVSDCLRCHNKDRLQTSYKKKVPPANRGK